MKYIRKRIYIISVLVAIIIIVGLVTLKVMLKRTSEISMDINNNIKEEISEDEDTVTYFRYVDIKGEIINPGVYTINDNTRVIDIINIAGGLTENADTSLINLSKRTFDEMVIIIYSKEEANKVTAGNDKECICPTNNINNDACINNDTIDTSNKNQNTDNSKISLNTASVSELTTVPGIGEAKANAIIEYRTNNNGFKTIDELKSVSGIGDSTYEKIKDYFSL